MADEVVQHYIYNISGGETSSIKDGDTDNTVTYDPGLGTGTITVDVNPGDYVEWEYSYYQYDDPAVPSQYSWFDLTPYYVYTANNVWKYAGNSKTNNTAECGYQNYYNTSYCIATDSEDNEITEGSTGTEIKLTVRQDAGDLIRAPLLNSNSIYYHYTGSVVLPFADPDNYGTIQYLTGTVTVQPKYGDVLTDGISYVLRYQYPGVWVDDNNYPDLTISPEPPQVKSHVQLKWTDPPDITDWKPTPATWEGTVIVRKENSAPLHRWDGDKVVRTTTRDKYKSKPYKDEDIETNKVYYYAFMPYYTKIDDPQHPIRYYTFTKCIRVETGTISYIPEIIKIDMNEDVATITYAITLPATGPYDTAKLYGKKDGNPACDNTDDIVENISQVDNQIVVPDIDGDYYFCIQVANGTDTLTSDVVSCTGENPVPEEYRQYINLINGCNGEGLDFFWKDYSVTGASRLTAIDNPANFSYVRPTGNWDGNEVIVISANTSNSLVASSIITLNINKQENDTYKVIVIGYDIAINQNRYAYSFQYSFYTATNNSLVASNDYVNQYVLDNYWKMGIFVYDFGTLTAALQFLTKNVRNANIYVDGVLWSKANNID